MREILNPDWFEGDERPDWNKEIPRDLLDVFVAIPVGIEMDLNGNDLMYDIRVLKVWDKSNRFRAVVSLVVNGDEEIASLHFDGLSEWSQWLKFAKGSCR